MTEHKSIGEIKREFETEFRFISSAPILDLVTQKERNGKPVLLSDVNNILLSQMKCIYKHFLPHLNSRNLLERFVKFIPNSFENNEDTRLTAKEYKDYVEALLDEFIESESQSIKDLEQEGEE